MFLRVFDQLKEMIEVLRIVVCWDQSFSNFYSTGDVQDLITLSC